ncbi:Histone H1-like protein HC2 [Labilithrix luteola]|uniref:Histone H1-like protein HC2 n=1 Tax=Labilithrix luteola TaxID=1391654 RepID=A0A0K1QCB0_9BACT|nr:histone H1-like repetitive region-containing protein [Labilithrix luteola]AKV03363.1 Histone H1-like protein HC2 [Labilithrix luteola]
MKTPANSDPREGALRAAKIVETLGEGPKSADVFEAFEELDALPSDVVKDAFEAWTGPAPDPERLDAATRKAHGFAPPALVLRLVRLERPTSTDKLPALEQEQLRLAGTAWDGLDLPAAERLAPNGGESTFAGTFERRTIVGTEESASFDVLLYRDGSGTIFRGDSTAIVGAIAYGVVEMSDRRAREGLQEALTQTEAKPLPVAVKVEIAEAPVVTIVEETTEPTPAKAPKKAAAKKVATKKVAAEKPAAKKAAAKKVATKKVAAEKPAAKKAAAKKVATKKAAAKKTTAKKVATKKVTAKKPAATKIAPKKPTAKKAAVSKTTTKKPVAKKATAKKPAAKKIAAKKTAPKKPAAKKPVAKKATAKKPASKKRAK